MDSKKLRFRIGVFAVLMIAIVFIFGMELYRLQIVEGEEHYQSSETYSQYKAVEAARGSLLDRYGRVLVSNRTGYNVGLNSMALYNAGGVNANLTALIKLADSLGYEHIDTLPMNEDGSEYLYDEYSTTTSETYFRRFLKEKGWDTDITSPNVYQLLRDEYNIDESLTNREARELVGLRYELDLRSAVGMDAYIFVEDVASEDLSYFKETDIPGIEINTVTYREYNTDYAAHILGRVGLMNPEEYEYYKTLGYPMDASVGKEGVEKAFEEYLHGEDGQILVTTDANGTIVGEKTTKEAKAGGNVYLTIDIVMQEIAERALESCILDLRAGSEDISGEDADIEAGTDARGGAVVVMDVDSFEVLTMASYPSFNIETFSEDFTMLAADEYSPLYNRSLLAAYSPGSTYKMVTAAAAVGLGVVSPMAEIECTGVYRFYEEEGYAPVCNFFKNTGVTHQQIDMMEALSYSCNIYFYETGRQVGLSALEEYARSFGLGESTGIELDETTGTVAGDDSRYDWYAADTISGAIGQSGNTFTPLQMCAYACTLANGGTRYNASLLSRVVSSDYKLEYETAAKTVMSNAMLTETARQAVFDGMLLASKEGTASSVFATYDIDVCSKTGTVQHGGLGSDHAAFLCFAPYDDPEIAIYVFVENGAKGGNLATVAKSILDYYFNTDEIAQEYVEEYTIIK